MSIEHSSGSHFGYCCQQSGRRIVQRANGFELSILFCLAQIPLNHTGKSIDWIANDNITELDLGWNPATDANHQDRPNELESSHHLIGASSSWIVSKLSARQTGYNDLMVTDRSQSIRIGIIWRLGKVKMNMV